MNSNKKNFILKGIIGIISFAILIMVFISPNLFKRLQGNVNSIDISTNTAVNTGVVIDTNLIFNKESNKVPLKIYNGAKKDITINAYIYRTYCETKFNCNTYQIVNLDSPIVVKADTETEYVISDAYNALDQNYNVEVGVQYALDGKTYNIYTYSFDTSNFDRNSMNTINYNKTEKEFVFHSTAESGKGDEDLYMKINDSDVYMDISENLEKLDLKYYYKTSFGAESYYNHPQSLNSINQSMFGETNKSNIRNFFDYETDALPSKALSSNGRHEEYSDSFSHTLVGTPKNVYTNLDVIPGFYYRWYWTAKWPQSGSYDHYSSNASPFSAPEIPHFTLTVYDKSGLASAIETSINKLNNKNEANVEFESWVEYRKLINEAILMYKSRDTYNGSPLNQAVINYMIKNLNTYTIQNKAGANYTALNELENKIDSLNINYYEPASYNSLMDVYNKKNDVLNLNSSYQSKVDNYVDRLNTAYDALVMYDADYTAVDETIKVANQIKNATEDGKYELYTKESWKTLQDAIASIDRTLKIKDQAIVDGYITTINNAIDDLMIAPAKYDELNKVINDYKNSDDYKNNWYTEETKNAVENYIANIANDKKITEQSDVDTYTSELKVLISELKYIKAKGYYDADNYKPFAGALSVEGYIRYFKELDRNLYSDVTLLLIDSLVSEYETGTDPKFNITIDKQADMDKVLKSYDEIMKDRLEKRKGNYEELQYYYGEALNLDPGYYDDISNIVQMLKEIVWDYKIDEQDKIDAQTKMLKDALEALVIKKADYTKFNELYETAKSLNESYYVDFSKVKVALEKAEALSKDLTIDKQNEIDVVTNELSDAISKLVMKKANYTEFNKVYNESKSLNESYYVDFSKVKVALEKAEALSKDLTIDKQNEIDVVTNELSDAVSKLVMKKANYTEFNNVYNEAKSLNESYYEDFSKVKVALEKAEALSKDLTIDKQNEVDVVTKELNDAISKLVMKKANYTEFNKVYNKAKSLNESYYEDFSKVKVALEKAEALSKDLTIDKQNEIDVVTNELSDAVSKLVMKKANYTEFNKVYNESKSLNESYYEDFSKVKVAIDKAEALSKDLTIDKQNEIDVVTKELNDAISKLVMKKANYTEFNKVYNKAKSLNESYYVDFSKVKVALTKAEALSKDLTIDKQNEIDVVTKELNDAVSKLVMKKANYTEFNKVYNESKSLNESYYVDFSKVKVALTKAEALSKDLTIDKQNEIDVITNELNDAVSKLVMKKADYSKINELVAIIEKLDKNKYTNFEIVTAALSNIVYDKKITEQDEVNRMYDNLKQAYDGLQKIKADYTKLEDSISNIKKYEEHKDYYSNYDFVMVIINGILDRIDYDLTCDDQNKVDDWAEKISSALATLNKKPADYSKLSEIISKLPNDYSKYDKSIRDELDAYIKEVRALPNSLKIDEQYKIDTLVEKGKKLLDKLSNIVLDDNKNDKPNNTPGNGNTVETTNPSISPTTKANGGNTNNNKPSSKPNNNNEQQNKNVINQLKVNGNKVDITSSTFKSIVSYNTTSANIEVGLINDSYTSKVYGASALVPGENEVTIVITDKSGKEYTYILIITRLKASNYLSNLVVKNYNIDFKKSKEEYTIRIDKDTDKLDLSMLAEDETAKISVKGNKNLKNGSKVVVEVKSSDGKVRTYIINVQKSTSIGTSIAIILVMILAVLAGVFKFIQTKKKAN